jgi:hypothetical protein
VEIAIAVAVCLWLWHLYAGNVYGGTRNRSLTAVARYFWIWAQHYGVLRFEVVPNPPLAVHNAELLVLVSSIAGTIAYSMIPPDHTSPAIAKRAAQSFVSLRRLLPTAAEGRSEKGTDARDQELVVAALRQHLVNEEYRRFMSILLPRVLRQNKLSPVQDTAPLLCLETALTYLEISYQTYFNAQPSAGPVVQAQGAVPASDAAAVANGAGANSAGSNVNHKNPFMTDEPTSDGSKNPFEEDDDPPGPVSGNKATPEEAQLNPFPEDLLEVVNSTNPFEEEAEAGVTPRKVQFKPATTSPYEGDYRDIAESYGSQAAAGDGEVTEPVPEYGPRINLAGLGYTLKSTFSCEQYTTFGFLCEEDATGKIVVAFRGSLPGNHIRNLKFAQIALPRLKRHRNYFTALIRRGEPVDGPLTSSMEGEQFSGREIARTPTSELIPELDPQHSAGVYEFDGIYSRIESGDDVYEEDTNFRPPPEVPTDGYHDTQLARDLKTVGSAIPLVRQGFKRVHAGFWESYASIREQFLEAVVLAMFEQRKKRIREVQASSSVSPGSSWYVQASSSAGGPAQQLSTDNTLHAAMDGVRSLFASPFSVKNPFSSPAPQPAAAVTPSPRTPGMSTNAAGDVVFEAPELVLCGHSLGGAIASLAALELAENMHVIMEAFTLEECFNVPKSKAVSKIPAVLSSPAPALSLYTYGSPRVGNPVFGGSIEKKISTIFRFQVNGDLVTMMPKLVGFYRHFGTTVILDEEETGSIIIEPTVIERSILRRSMGSVRNHSLDKYRTCLEASLEPTELEEYLAKEFSGLSGSVRNGYGVPAWLTGRSAV